MICYSVVQPVRMTMVY